MLLSVHCRITEPMNSALGQVFHTILAPVANLIEILQSSYFLWGLALGGLALIGVRGNEAVRTGDDPLPIGGVLIAAASMGAASLAGDLPSAVWIGVGVIVLLTLMVENLDGSPIVIAAASIPGAVVVALAGSSEPAWVRLVVVVSIPIIGFLINDFESRYGGHGLGVIYFGLAALGTFLAVPDTEWVRTLFAVALPISFLAWPRVLVTVGPAGAYAAGAVFALFTSEGGTGRPASVIGALACLGLLLIEPVLFRARPQIDLLRAQLLGGPMSVLIAAVPQFAIVLVNSRIAAHYFSPIRSAAVVAVVFALTCGALIRFSDRRVGVLG
jgi:hypothetical protein